LLLDLGYSGRIQSNNFIQWVSLQTNFTLHMATHNTGDPKCPECGRKYARMASLKSHMLLHEKEENLFCTECEDAFSTKVSLRLFAFYLSLHIKEIFSYV